MGLPLTLSVPVPEEKRIEIRELFPDFDQRILELLFENALLCYQMLAQTIKKNEGVSGMFYMNWDVTWCYYTTPHKIYSNTNPVGSGLTQYLRQQIADTIRRTWILYESQKDQELFFSQLENRYAGLLVNSNEWGRFLALPKLSEVSTFPANDFLNRFVDEPEHQTSTITPDEITDKTIKPHSYTLIWNNNPTFIKVFRREKFPHENQDTILICFPTPNKEVWETIRQPRRSLYEQQQTFDRWLARNFDHRYTIKIGLKPFFDFHDTGKPIPDFGNCFLNLHPLGNEHFREPYLQAFPPIADLECFLTPEVWEDCGHWLVFADWLEDNKQEKQLCELIRFFLGDCPIDF